ncbi:hypothetical protein Z966_01995 [Clostridium novyi A str. NCTC 538]|nr:hypothetical protein Z966_01995 [Clostridium novyi A str. NCTC 538]
MLVIDSETRLILSYHLTPSRYSEQAYSTLNSSKKVGTPNSIVQTDYLYNQAVNAIFPDSKHIKVQSFQDDISNNLIFMFIFYYNFIRPHSSLNQLSPVEVPGIKLNSIEKST